MDKWVLKVETIFHKHLFTLKICIKMYLLSSYLSTETESCNVPQGGPELALFLLQPSKSCDYKHASWPYLAWVKRIWKSSQDIVLNEKMIWGDNIISLFHLWLTNAFKNPACSCVIYTKQTGRPCIKWQLQIS